MASASSNYTPGSFPASGANNGERAGNNWGAGGGWNDAAPGNTFSDWLQIDFNGSKTIDEISVFTSQDQPFSPSEPTEAMTFSIYGLTQYDVQYWNGSGWANVPGGQIAGDNKVWRKVTFAPLSTSKIRVWTHASVDGYSRITEVEAWGPGESGGASAINWLVADQLGTPRMIFDKSGSLAATKRHDYLPFGEELYAGQGLRTTTLGYSGGDGLRQQFTSKERDIETGLDYFLARYYSSTQGRFTTVDPLRESAKQVDPQTWNRYTYVLNRPTIAIDPDGLSTIVVIVSPGSAPRATIQVFDRGGNSVSRTVEGTATGQGRNRQAINNDTPYGVYEILPNYNGSNANGTQGGAIMPARANQPEFGTGIITMEPVSGEAFNNQGQQVRDNIYIHGGGRPLSVALDPEQPLTPTQGCIRVQNRGINSLIGTVNDLANNGDPITNIFVGDLATLQGQADQTDGQGNYSYPELRRAGFGTPDVQGRPVGNTPDALRP